MFYFQLLSLILKQKRSSQNAPDLEHVRRLGTKQSLLSRRGEKVLGAKEASHVPRLLDVQRHKQGL